MTTRPAGALVGDAGDPLPTPETGPPPGLAASGAARWRTAHHEASHACAAWAFGRPLKVVSIRPGESYNGVTISGNDEPKDLDLGGYLLDAPVALQPPELRAAIERAAMVSLAGDLAGEAAALIHEPIGGWLPDPDTQAIEEALAALPPRSRELIVESEARTESIPSDDERAAGLVSLLTTSEAEADAYLAWLRVSADDLVRFQWPRITRLALALLERHYIDGPEAVRILRGDDAAVIQPAGPLPAQAKE